MPGGDRRSRFHPRHSGPTCGPAKNFRAERRDAAREATGSRGGEGPDAWLMALDREPRPEEAVILAETVERLFLEASAHERPVLELSLQGHSTSEISVRLGRA